MKRDAIPAMNANRSSEKLADKVIDFCVISNTVFALSSIRQSSFGPWPPSDQHLG